MSFLTQSRAFGKALIISLSLLVVVSSCKNRSADKFLLHRVEKKDYLDKIEVSGIVTAKKSVKVTCPRIYTNNITIAYLIDEGTIVKKGDTVCILEATEIQENYINEVDEVATEKAALVKMKADLDLKKLLLESEVKSNEVQTTIHRLDSMQLQFSTESQRRITELELQKAEVQRKKLINKLAFQEKINGSELKKKSLEIKKKENSVNRARAQLEKLTLTSAQDGIVIYSVNWISRQKSKEGDKVYTNFPIVEMPDYEEFNVELNVGESNYKRIEKGQDVKISFDAVPNLTLTGKVLRKAPVGKPIAKGSKVKLFDIVVSVEGKGHELQSGLTALCDINISSVSDTIVVPTAGVFESDSSKIVYVYEDDEYIERRVNTGLWNNKETIIKKGLTGGELIALFKPSDDMILKDEKEEKKEEKNKSGEIFITGKNNAEGRENVN